MVLLHHQVKERQGVKQEGKERISPPNLSLSLDIEQGWNKFWPISDKDEINFDQAWCWSSSQPMLVLPSTISKFIWGRQCKKKASSLWEQGKYKLLSPNLKSRMTDTLRDLILHKTEHSTPSPWERERESERERERERERDWESQRAREP